MEADWLVRIAQAVRSNLAPADTPDEAALAGRYAELCAYVEELQENGAEPEAIVSATQECQQVWMVLQAAQIDITDELPDDEDDSYWDDPNGWLDDEDETIDG